MDRHWIELELIESLIEAIQLVNWEMFSKEELISRLRKQQDIISQEEDEEEMFDEQWDIDFLNAIAEATKQKFAFWDRQFSGWNFFAKMWVWNKASISLWQTQATANNKLVKHIKAFYLFVS